MWRWRVGGHTAGAEAGESERVGDVQTLAKASRRGGSQAEKTAFASLQKQMTSLGTICPFLSPPGGQAGAGQRAESPAGSLLSLLVPGATLGAQRAAWFPSTNFPKRLTQRLHLNHSLALSGAAGHYWGTSKDFGMGQAFHERLVLIRMLRPSAVSDKWSLHFSSHPQPPR